MRDLIGKYNRNRKKIWFFVGITIAAWYLLRLMNNNFKTDEIISAEKKYKDNTTINQTSFYETNYSVISEKKISVSQNEKAKQYILDFISCCNNKQYEEAYAFLSDDCKEVLYANDINNFIEEYVDIFFNVKKTCNIQLWNDFNNVLIYKIELMEDMLDMGYASNTVHQDYYTVIKNDDKYTLNVAGFIEKNKIDCLKEENQIEILIDNEEIFMNYSNINIKVHNKNNNPILLDSGDKGMGTYIEDEKKIKYNSYLFEEINSNLTVNPNSELNLTIKFMKEFKKERPIDKIVFSDIVLNYKQDNEQKIKIEIDA